MTGPREYCVDTQESSFSALWLDACEVWAGILYRGDLRHTKLTLPCAIYPPRPVQSGLGSPGPVEYAGMEWGYG